MKKDEAIRLGKSEVWKDWTPYERAYFQLHEDLLCMPFEVFHKSVEEALGRPVWSHEFGLNIKGLRAELEGKGEKPSFDDILNMIPEEKRVVVEVDHAQER